MIRDDAAGDPILEGLNNVQREAVLFEGGPLLVLSGAGSGKTRVLTRRVAHLILRRQVPPDRILAVTFTNKAAAEMRHRVEAMLGFDARSLWIGTFHSLCLRWLRRHGERLGFPGGRITVFDADDSASLIRSVLREEENVAESPRVRDVQTLISMAKNRLWEPDDLEREWPRPERHRMAALYRAYQKKLRDQQGADFDDLLGLAVRLFEEHRDIGDAWARKFLHILVDEYQDTNHIQFRLVRRLAEGHGNILVVGDDDQSIYGWRGADITNILEFENRFPRAHILRMTQNYRSSRPILDLANAVISHNESRHPKSLWTENTGGARPVFFCAEDEEEEARGIIGRIHGAVRVGEMRYGDAAVLYRVHALSRSLEEACLNLGISYTLVGGTVFYQRREVKDLLAYLRLAANPRDAISFARALGAPSRGIGAVGLARIAEAAAARGGDLAAACADLAADSGLRGRSLTRAREFGALLVELAARAHEGPEPLLREVVDRTGYLDWLRESGERDWEERTANVYELLEGAGRFQESFALPGEPEGGILNAWLDQVALYTSLDMRAGEADRITLMSVHNAKGLEFPHVYIAGLEDGLFPHASSFADPAEMEEERRLFYVATTRAMKTLCLSASMERRRANWMGSAGLSRFFDEIPRDLLVEEAPLPGRRIGGRGYWGRAGGSDRALRSDHALRRDHAIGPNRADHDDPDHALGPNRADHDNDPDHAAAVIRREPRQQWKGRRVEHKIFGAGTVESQEGDGPEARLSVVFPQVGRKKILARFVRMLG